MGIATEIDSAEAFQPVTVLRRAFWLMLVLLILCAAGIFAAMLYIARQQRHLQHAAIAAKRLGQYSLEEKLGAGGMGTVYKARHAMLRRATAVKLLDVDKMSETAITRFEREVQLTSGLTHPNTVAIFDYGRTPEGIFYYAMEYLDGMNLESLVHRTGPLPEARAVYLLRQICGALGEAHAAGLIHRDIKPANIFLTTRGGLNDFVKVLDFGLVKSLDSEETAGVTNPNGVTGTPLYISPEAVYHPEQIDARSDVYAVGAVGYYLLTGSPVFNGESVVQICMAHVKSVPELPSARLGKPISADLEALLMRCLAKDPADRPADANELLVALKACSLPSKWTADDATGWWTARAAAQDHRAPDPGLTAQYSPMPTEHSPNATIAYQGEAKKR
jgi:serine/threonine protein kinase